MRRVTRVDRDFLVGLQLVVLALALVIGTFASAPAVARAAAISWSGATAVDTSSGAGEQLRKVACPATNQCTTIDGTGRELTFDPAAPGTPAPVVIDSAAIALTGVDCPAANQCSAVDAAGREVTFDPTAPAGTAPEAPTTIESGRQLVAVTCVSISQCTALESVGTVLTFDPASPGTPIVGNVGLGFSMEGAPGSGVVNGLSCASDTQCVEVGSHGQEVLFDPRAPGTPPAYTIDGATLTGVACPSATQCTAVDNGGAEITFDPGQPDVNPVAPSGVTSAQIATGGLPLLGVVCSSPTQCTAIDSAGEVTFDPAQPGTPTVTAIPAAGGGNLAAVACASPSQCTAVDASDGSVVTFNPASPGTPSPATIDGGSDLIGIACPAAVQCTAIEYGGTEVTFDPAAPGPPAPVQVDPSGSLDGPISCPSATQCTAVGDGLEVTFDPTSAGSRTGSTIDDGNLLTGLACPSNTQCTAVSGGSELTFDPTSVETPEPVAIDSGLGLDAVACPSTAQCTAVDTSGREVTFNPTSSGTPTPVTIGQQLTSVACPSTTQCTAVTRGGGGLELTFNPTAPGMLTSAAIDPTPNSQLTGVACPATNQCTAIDFLGQAVTFDPTMPATAAPLTALAAAYALSAVACSSISECVAVDGVGDGFIESVDHAVPVIGAPPVISGTPAAGQTLTDTQGTWSNNPQSFAYQWEDCDASGNACAAISGATGQTHVLLPSDVGQTIRVVETASNNAGPGMPATSAQTAVVLEAVPVNASPPAISGTVVAGQTLSEAHGSWANNPTSFAYQWEDCDGGGNACAGIPGATGQSYALASGDVGHTIRVLETASNATGPSSSASSGQSGVVAPAPPPAVTAIQPVDQTLPLVTGTARVGGSVVASSGTWSGTAPISYAYQWQRCGAACSNIAGATGSAYALVEADLGSKLRVVVTATNTAGSATSMSAMSGTVSPKGLVLVSAQVLIAGQGAPTGKASAIAALLKAGGATISFKALMAGAAVVDWYYVPPGAHIAKAKPKAVLVASGGLTFRAAGAGKIKVKLTVPGKKLLKSERTGHAKLVKLTVKTSFTPHGGRAVVGEKSFMPGR